MLRYIMQHDADYVIVAKEQYNNKVDELICLAFDKNGVYTRTISLRCLKMTKRSLPELLPGLSEPLSLKAIRKLEPFSRVALVRVEFNSYNDYSVKITRTEFIEFDESSDIVTLTNKDKDKIRINTCGLMVEGILSNKPSVTYLAKA